MNENDNKDIMNISNTPDIETLETPVEQTFNNNTGQNLNSSINTLNNIDNTTKTNINNQLKNNAKKTPFLIIAAVIICLLLAGGTGVVIKTQIFDKAPNDPVVPGELTDDDENSGKEDEDIEEGTVGIEGNIPDEDIIYIQVGDSEVAVKKDEYENQDKVPTKYENIESAITEHENYSPTTPSYNSKFDTYEGYALFRFGKKNDGYLIEHVGYDMVVSAVADLENPAIKTEIFRRTYNPTISENDDGSITTYSYMVEGYISNNYLLLKIVNGITDNFFMILDSNMNIIYEGVYYEQSKPQASNTAFFFGALNCNGKKSNNTYGPVIEIYKFDTKTGISSYQYNIDYDNKANVCK